MAVAANARDYGSSRQATLVKQPLIIQASFPRFLSPGDEFTVPVTVFNNTPQSGNVTLACESTGGVQFTDSDTLPRDSNPREVSVHSGREGTTLLHAKAPLIPRPRDDDDQRAAGRTGHGSGRAGRASPRDAADRPGRRLGRGREIRPIHASRRLGPQDGPLHALVLKPADAQARPRPQLSPPLPVRLRRADNVLLPAAALPERRGVGGRARRLPQGGHRDLRPGWDRASTVDADPRRRVQ